MTTKIILLGVLLVAFLATSLALHPLPSREKSGTCPRMSYGRGRFKCSSSACRNDYECSGDKKCCGWPRCCRDPVRPTTRSTPSTTPTATPGGCPAIHPLLCLPVESIPECAVDSDCGVNRICCPSEACNRAQVCRDRPATTAPPTSPPQNPNCPALDPLGRCLTVVLPTECAKDSDCGLNRICCTSQACNRAKVCQDLPTAPTPTAPTPTLPATKPGCPAPGSPDGPDPMGRCLTFIAPSECDKDSDCGINRICCKVGAACTGGEQCRDRPVTAGY